MEELPMVVSGRFTASIKTYVGPTRSEVNALVEDVVQWLDIGNLQLDFWLSRPKHFVVELQACTETDGQADGVQCKMRLRPGILAGKVPFDGYLKPRLHLRAEHLSSFSSVTYERGFSSECCIDMTSPVVHRQCHRHHSTINAHLQHAGTISDLPDGDSETGFQATASNGTLPRAYVGSQLHKILCHRTIFGRQFVKRFALCYRTVVLSVCQ